MESLPRLSTRLNVALYEKNLGDTEFVSFGVDRYEAVLRHLEARDNLAHKFSVDFFTQGKSSSVKLEIQRLFKDFLRLVSTDLCSDGDDTDQQLAYTSYHILSRSNISPAPVYKEYFTYRDMKQSAVSASFMQSLAQARDIAIQLKSHADSTPTNTAQKKAIATDYTQWPSGIVFNVPQLLTTAINRSSTRLIKADKNIPTGNNDGNMKKSSEENKGRSALPLPGVAVKQNLDAKWLLDLCMSYIASSGECMQHMTADALAREFISITSDSNVSAREEKLFELVGISEGGFELMMEIMSNADRAAGIPLQDLHIVVSPFDGNLNNAISNNNDDDYTSSLKAGVHTQEVVDLVNDDAYGDYGDDYEYNPADFDAAPDVHGKDDEEYQMYLYAMDMMPQHQIDNMTFQTKKKFDKQKVKILSALENDKGSTTGGTNANNGDEKIDWLKEVGFSQEYLEQERALGLEKFKKPTLQEKWHEGLAPEGTKVYREQNGLPAGTKRKTGQGWEEVDIPAAKNKDMLPESALIRIESLESWAQLAFPKMQRLNTIQSTVYETAYNNSENMLVCAPTGAGKTNIAMLTFLQLLKQYIDPEENTLDKEAIKAIYIAPMKALAQEVVQKFGERVEPLGLKVREFTGDMQLTKAEIADSQVCSPLI